MKALNSLAGYMRALNSLGAPPQAALCFVFLTLEPRVE
jgi:hypothetical protein